LTGPRWRWKKDVRIRYKAGKEVEQTAWPGLAKVNSPLVNQGVLHGKDEKQGQ
jgi:hypothetical protein